jgi:hypothetical protein
MEFMIAFGSQSATNFYKYKELKDKKDLLICVFGGVLAIAFFTIITASLMIMNKKYSCYEGKYKDLFNVDIQGGCIYNEREKEYLKVISKSATMKLHPDATGGDSEGFLFLTKLKEQWKI